MPILKMVPEKLFEGKYHVAGRGPMIVDMVGERLCTVRSGNTRTEQAAAEHTARLFAASFDMFELVRAISYDECQCQSYETEPGGECWPCEAKRIVKQVEHGK